MPFDTATSDAAPDLAHGRRNRRVVALWLFGMCGMVAVMVALGGATRLTGSGLSIMEWAPLRGTLPPLNEAEWHRIYALYQTIPQYELVNKGFGLDGFKQIFWLEWAHRLWGRLIGLAFLLPLVWFAVRGMIPRRMVPGLAGLFVLGGLQGAVGWFMVASGFAAQSTTVSPYRLVMHLGLALVLYAALLWTALSLWRQDAPAPAGSPALRRSTALTCALTCALVALTVLAGGFVAGMRAGLTYNTYPLMDGRWVPEGYAMLQPFARNLTENVAAVQFNHRLLATLAAAAAVATVWLGLRRPQPPGLRIALLALGAAVGLQYALGIATLLAVVPVGLGTLHQTGAVLVLTAALVALHLQRSPRPRARRVPTEVPA